MSIQTHSPSVPSPSGLGWLGRARFGIGKMFREPNPIWIRELRQSARVRAFIAAMR